jgi:hypothetical protein
VLIAVMKDNKIMAGPPVEVLMRIALSAPHISSQCGG